MENSKKWIILSVVTLVSFITNVDSTIVTIGLPKLMKGLNINLVTGLLAITAYIIASTVLLLPAGRWADMIGTKRIFILGFVIFTIGTVLCGFSNSGVTLIVYRIIQGVGAALALATATPIIVKTFPNNQLGLALGINSTSWVIGALVGPIVGGILISKFGWQSIFFVTVPFAIIGIIGAVLVLKETETNKEVKNDWIGILAFGIGLTAVMIALSEGESWGWVSKALMGLLIVAIIFLAVFIINEYQVQNPLFNLRLFSYKNYTLGLGITLSYCIAYFSLSLILTIYLQGALHLSALDSSFLLIPLSLPQLVMGPLGGKFADKFGTKPMIVLGSVFLIIGSFMLGNLGFKLSIIGVVVPLIIMSVANGIAWPSLAKQVLSAVPKEESGAASGMFYTIYNLGRALSQTLAVMAIGFTISPTIVSKAIVGMADLKNLKTKGDLVTAIDFSFHFFSAFFIIVFILGLALMYEKKVNKIKEQEVDTAE
ncbi:drug resistance transporter, EmrB/QacA subfamily [Clostridium acidisoli DSM 12555]|uniref:Drug resistance transporter, EmrB/QacA subfamily n=1 Tax=Clostridium acidisoli DSM 12555 TaxID=1121291 RepID=A0A1W1X2F2_9CLOT|nr:MFS transporter [Clostridium acidisoli]SMC18159.1 drug resistance transporter, EmrB/QacA subfamily [Clostridium acidisoli DSM 12555]